MMIPFYLSVSNSLYHPFTLAVKNREYSVTKIGIV